MSVGESRVLRESRASAGPVRLVCFPHAGAGASAYRGWADLLAPDLRVITVQYPGREDRIREPAHRRLDPLLDELVPELRAALDGPFALYGHSMGALVAYEVARRLRAGPGALSPAHLFVSGRAAPHIVDRDARLALLPDADFHAAVGRLSGFPAEVLADPALMRLLEPTLRADFQLCEDYRHVPGPPLACPVSVFGGTEDTVRREHLDGWHEHTEARCAVHMLPGDHAFVMTRRDEVTAAIRAALDVSSPARDEAVR